MRFSELLDSLVWLQGQEEARVVWGNLSQVLGHVIYICIYVSLSNVPGLAVTASMGKYTIEENRKQGIPRTYTHTNLIYDKGGI